MHLDHRRQLVAVRADGQLNRMQNEASKMDKSRILTALLVIAACMVFAEPATAGRRATGGRVLFVFFGNEGSVSGQFGGTRNSVLDTTEYISCQSTVKTNPGPNEDYWSGSC